MSLGLFRYGSEGAHAAAVGISDVQTTGREVRSKRAARLASRKQQSALRLEGRQSGAHGKSLQYLYVFIKLFDFGFLRFNSR